MIRHLLALAFPADAPSDTGFHWIDPSEATELIRNKTNPFRNVGWPPSGGG